MVEEGAHLPLAARELHQPVLFPESIVATGGTGHHLFLPTAQGRLLYRREVEVAAARRSGDHGTGDEVGHLQFNNHVVDRQQPLAVWLPRELLHALETLNPVYVGSSGQRQLAALHLIGGVGHDIDLTAKAEVLLIVGHEIKVYAAVLTHVDGVGNIETIELNGITADGAAELMTQQQDVVIVDVDIREYVAHHGCQDVSRLEQVVHARRFLADGDGLLLLGVLPVQMLCNSLINGERQHQLVVVLADLYLTGQPGIFPEDALIEHGRADIVQTEGQLLVVRIAIEIVLLQVVRLLVGNHSPHQLHSRIVLSAIACLFLRLHRHLLQRLMLLLQSDGQRDGR